MTKSWIFPRELGQLAGDPSAGKPVFDKERDGGLRQIEACRSKSRPEGRPERRFRRFEDEFIYSNDKSND